MREVRQAADAGDPRAVLARTMFVARAASAIAAAATALPRLDGLVFTGGIGEHDVGVRAAITARLAVLGVPAVGATDGADDATDEDAILQGSPGGVAVLRVTAREDLVIANEVSALLRR
jgi:acetate kinase